MNAFGYLASLAIVLAPCVAAAVAGLSLVIDRKA